MSQEKKHTQHITRESKAVLGQRQSKGGGRQFGRLGKKPKGRFYMKRGLFRYRLKSVWAQGNIKGKTVTFSHPLRQRTRIKLQEGQIRGTMKKKGSGMASQSRTGIAAPRGNGGEGEEIS